MNKKIKKIKNCSFKGRVGWVGDQSNTYKRVDTPDSMGCVYARALSIIPSMSSAPFPGTCFFRFAKKDRADQFISRRHLPTVELALKGVLCTRLGSKGSRCAGLLPLLDPTAMPR